jgi:large subunit ribosomal protein L24
MTVRTGDTVGVLSGKDRGKRGKIERVLPGVGKVVVEGINLQTHHLKPSKTRPKGGIIQAPGAMSAAKVMIACPHCSKLTRIRVNQEGETRFRACTHCGGSLDTVS